MNLLRLLFTFYFAALTLMPCNDVKAQSVKGNSEKKFSYSEDNHSKDHGDICSPLCSCNCCQMTVTSLKVEPLMPLPKKAAEYFSKKIHFQKNDFAYLVYDQIWQPPKI